MKRFSFFSCSLLILFSLCRPGRAGLPEEIRAVLADKNLARVSVGISVARLDDRGPVSVFENNSRRLFIPASNLKLITTSAALHRLGPDFRFRTYFLVNGNDVILWGDGDPTLGDAEMLKPLGWDVNTVYKSWAEQLLKKNLTAVGDVIVDDSVFDEVFLHPNWPADQVHKRYVAEIGGVNLNANCIDFLVQASGPGQIVGYSTDPLTRYITVANTCVTGNENAIWLSRMPQTNELILRGQSPRSIDVPVSVTIHDPSLFAATVLAETLAQSGVAVTGSIRRDRATRQQYAQDKENPAAAKNWSVVAVHETPLETVLARANKDSMNLYAESLCKRLGHAASGESGSWQNGLAAIGQFLAGARVDSTEFNLDDGSGLSRMNQISPDAIVKVLAFNHTSPHSEQFMNSLAVAGQDGTLKERFRGTDLGGRVFGKSGYISGVSSLSGYIHGVDNRWYAFSILMNDIPNGSNSTMKTLQERIVRAIDANSR